MNAPFFPSSAVARLADPGDREAIARFLADHPDATAFHRVEWLDAVETATGHKTHVLLSEQDGAIRSVLPLHEVHSPLFGRALVSTGFGVGGGVVGEGDAALFAAAQELAVRLNCPSLELRGGPLPQGPEWHVKADSHAGFVMPLAADDDAQLLTIPRKQRAEVRRGLGYNMEVRTGRSADDRAMHYAVYAESVRNLGTPVFPKRLFVAAMDAFGDDADILTVLQDGQPLASVLSL